MVHTIRRDCNDSTKNNFVFDVTGDVEMFFFFFKNVSNRGRNGEKRAEDLLASLIGEVFEFY